MQLPQAYSNSIKFNLIGISDTMKNIIYNLERKWTGIRRKK
jgi:hypothetical protein